MNATYGRDLDLNLLRVFAVVAEEKSATAAAARLYLTQPAISAALKRLNDAIGAPLFVRQGRGLALTARGAQLFASVAPHLGALVEATLKPAAFDARTSARTFRIGLADAAETWLLPALVRNLSRTAPHMRIIALAVQFRTVAEMLASGAVDVAVTVADELPADIRRRPLFHGDFVCLFDPRHVRLRDRHARPTMSRAEYLAHEHVIVSYNGDLRGIIEDLLGIQRKVRCSVSSFHGVGALVDDTGLIATVPRRVAADIIRLRPHLRTAEKPFTLAGSPIEMLWRAAVDDDDASRFLRDQIAMAAAANAQRAQGLEAGRRRRQRR